MDQVNSGEAPAMRQEVPPATDVARLTEAPTDENRERRHHRERDPDREHKSSHKHKSRKHHRHRSRKDGSGEQVSDAGGDQDRSYDSERRRKHRRKEHKKKHHKSRRHDSQSRSRSRSAERLPGQPESRFGLEARPAEVRPTEPRMTNYESPSKLRD